MISDSSSSPGSIYSFIAAFSAAYRPFKSITALNIYFREGVGASKRIFTLLDISKTHNNNANQISIINEIDNIEIKNISLIKDEKVIINNISLKIQGPINIAIIGESGSGKTSLANIICGFWTPSSGEVLINKNNINLYSNNSLRKNIAYITQNTKLFNIKIKDNISYPNVSDNLDRIKEASKLALADEFISNLKNEYDYIVKDNGSKFSAGQLQKISIARILYKNSSLIVFDEATNSIDYHTEQKIKANILNNGKKINIFITHKIDSLQDFDQIIMMKNGSITEIGTHDQLIQNKEEYFYLFKKNSSIKGENIKN
jgi:subfamily B ATP-binding cassette protein MsbA